MKIPRIKECPDPKCLSTRLRYTKREEEFLHYGEFTCFDCGRHIGWVSVEMGQFLDRLTITEVNHNDE